MRAQLALKIEANHFWDNNEVLTLLPIKRVRSMDRMEPACSLPNARNVRGMSWGHADTISFLELAVPITQWKGLQISRPIPLIIIVF